MEKNDKLIMVVDDEPTMCRILERILSTEGYRVIAAREGKTALELFQKHSPDVVILDLMLPGMNGREICHKIKEASAATKIIYLTAKAAPTDALESRELKSEADAFIAKPASQKQITSGIRKVLASSEGSGGQVSPWTNSKETGLHPRKAASLSRLIG